MFTQQTINKLQGLRLKGMAEEYRKQLELPSMQNNSFDDRLGLMVDYEMSQREHKKLQRLIKQATFRYDAQLEDIDYRASRGLNKQVIGSLSHCDWIRMKQNILLTGATGTSKSWLACALGNQACRLGFSISYKGASQLYEELQLRVLDGSLPKYRKSLSKLDVLVIDDFGLSSINESVSHILLDIVDQRMQAGSLIITSQFPTEHWYNLFSDQTVAEAILDRIVHKSHNLLLKGESLRKEIAKK